MLPTRQLRGTTSLLAYLALLRAEIARFTPGGLPCGTPPGLVSVALILTSRWRAVSSCAVLCSPDARYAIAERKSNGTWHGQLISVPYDFAIAAQKARHEGRDDWAIALQTGYALR